MSRKIHKMLTREKYETIIRMYQKEDSTIKGISIDLNLNRQVIRNAIKSHIAGIHFIPPNEKQKITKRRINSTFSVEEQVIFNAIACKIL